MCTDPTFHAPSPDAHLQAHDKRYGTWRNGSPDGVALVSCITSLFGQRRQSSAHVLNGPDLLRGWRSECRHPCESSPRSGSHCQESASPAAQTPPPCRSASAQPPGPRGPCFTFGAADCMRGVSIIPGATVITRDAVPSEIACHGQCHAHHGAL